MPLAENDTVSTLGDRGQRMWLYPLRVAGRFVKARTAVAYVLITLLLIAPWIDVLGHPAMHFDIPNRRFYFWGLTLFATDANYLMFLFGGFIFSIFFFTALLGRVWCGWACPQTVFLESVIRPIEQLIEGQPSQRKKLDAAPWSKEKVLKKVLKFSAFLVVSGAIATTFTAYFLGRDGVLEAQADPFSHPVGTTIFIAMTAVLMFDFGWFREQTCIVACPYGRFQSVLMDADSLTIAYDAGRGEPRGKPSDKGAGDCIDCKKCVVVCPTGIDIRKGIQMECVNCTACLDACDSIMDKLGRERGLIRYTSLNALEGKKLRLLRPRVIAYALALVAIGVGFTTAVSMREPVEIAVTRMTNAPFVVLPDGRVQNMMTLRISNKTAEPRTFAVAVVDPPQGEAVSPVQNLVVQPGQVGKFPLLLIRDNPNAASSTFTLKITDDQGFERQVGTPFLSTEPDGKDAT